MQAVIGGVAAQEAMKVRTLPWKSVDDLFVLVGCDRKIYANSAILLF